jgi:hypothetical protein
MRAAVPCAVAVTLLSGGRAAPAAESLHIEAPFGSRAAEVWILRPAGTIRSAVVFGPGWKAAPPSKAQPWVRQFTPWLEHLVAAGNALVFPRYQLGGDEPGAAFVAAYRSGLARALARLRASVPVVTAGYSVGATLAVTYAANAARCGLPRPVAVDAIFPAGLVPGVPMPPLRADVTALVQVGDRDTAAGRPGTAPVWAWLQGRARKRYDVVVSHDGFLAAHAAPKLSTPAARQAFWAPLDALIAAARLR